METTYDAKPKLKSIEGSLKTLPKWNIRPFSRGVMTAWLITADVLSLLLSGFMAIKLRAWLRADFSLIRYYDLIPLLLFFIVGYALMKLYPGVGMNPVEELRSLSYTTSAIVIAITALFFLTQTGLNFSRLVFLLFWMFSLVMVPIIRIFARKLGVMVHIWGEPVVLIGFGPQGKHIYQYLSRNLVFGIIPVMVVNGTENAEGKPETNDLEVPEIAVEELTNDNLLLKRCGIKTAILAPTEITQSLRNSLVDEQQYGLDRLILVSSLNWIGGSAVVPHDLGGLLGLEVERNLLHAREQIFKRCLDFGFSVFICTLGLPFLMLCAVIIKLDSPGPIFYKQRRVGKGGKDFWVWKFRTMVPDADKILEKYLSTNPMLKAEWEATRKLKYDPRITRVGKILRKLSLDELPQLLNVLKGEMSVIGPRPIVRDEVKYYQDGFKLYTQVLPGVSGLWQVSGRSDTSY